MEASQPNPEDVSCIFNLSAVERQALPATSAKLCFRSGLVAMGFVIIGIFGFASCFTLSCIIYGFAVLAGVYFLIEMIIKKFSYGYVQKGWLFLLGGILLYPLLWFILMGIFVLSTGGWVP